MGLPSLKIGLLILVVITILAFMFLRMRSHSHKKIIVKDDASDCSSEAGSDAESDDPVDSNSYDLQLEVDSFMDRQKQYLSEKK